jgi:hypothetical protein
MEGSPESDSPVFKQRPSDAHTEAETGREEVEEPEISLKKVDSAKEKKPLPKLLLCTA